METQKTNSSTSDSWYKLFAINRMVFLWLAFGLAGGVIAGLYWIVLEFLTHGLSFFTGYYVIPVMTVSGLLAGLIIHFIGDPGEIQLIVNNIRFKGGTLDPASNPSMILSSLLCISSGGSLGPEAPLVQVTGSTGTWLGRYLNLKDVELRSLTIAGMASGFTALFGAPLGGSLFALEILHHEHVVEYYEALIPAFVSSCASYVVFDLITRVGFGPIWTFPAFNTTSAIDFLYAVLLSIPAVIAGWIFIYLIRYIRSMLSKINPPIYIKTLTGGAILGVIAYYLPLTRYFGHFQLQNLLDARLSIGILVALLFGKIFTTAITVTSGWKGGFIFPLFFIGTTMGFIINYFFPSVNITLAAVSCMAALNSCVTRTPISTTLLLSSLTGFSFFVPIMFASLAGFFLAPRSPFITAQMDEI